MGVEIGHISKQNKVTSVVVMVHLFVLIALLLGELLINFENIINGMYIVIYIGNENLYIHIY